VIFERVRSLQSLVNDDIPIQSVYSVINVNELTLAAFSLTQASSFEGPCNPQKITNLNNSLKVSYHLIFDIMMLIYRFDDHDVMSIMHLLLLALEPSECHDDNIMLMIVVMMMMMMLMVMMEMISDFILQINNNGDDDAA
jgi:hypothetical protein